MIHEPSRRGCPRSFQFGFSLLEMLVTLFVIVIITSLVTINISSGGRDIQLQATVRNLAEVAAYALDEAQLTGVDYGLVLWRREQGGEYFYGYSWREMVNGVWREPASGKDVFAPRDFPADVELELELEGLPLEELPLTGDEAGEPQVVLYSSGETVLGALDIRHREDGELLWRLEWDLLGNFSILRRGLEEDDEWQ